jgi:hypothetical protein
MDWKIGLPLLVTAVLTMSGWFVGHWVSTWKDRSNKKRDLRTSYLIECFRRIEYAGNRDLDEIGRRQLEAAIADVQLFGSTEQAAVARAFANGIANRDDNASTGPLLCMLRDELREELDLPAVEVPLFHLRLFPGDKKVRAQNPGQ